MEELFDLSEVALSVDGAAPYEASLDVQNESWTALVSDDSCVPSKIVFQDCSTETSIAERAWKLFWAASEPIQKKYYRSVPMESSNCIN